MFSGWRLSSGQVGFFLAARACFTRHYPVQKHCICRRDTHNLQLAQEAK